MNKNWFLILSITCLILLTGNISAHAAGTVDWQVEKIGSFSVPEGWQATDIEQAASALLKEVKEKKVTPAPLSSVPLPDEIALPDLLGEINYKVYQVTMNDGKAYRTAILFFYRDNNLMTTYQKKYFLMPISLAEQQTLEADLTSASHFLRDALYQSYKKDNVGMTFLEVDRPEYLKINNRPAYGLSARIVFSIHGLNMPYYVKGYAFNASRFMATAVLLTSDSERSYWEPRIQNLVSSFKPISKIT